ncbi:hypothetical protein GCM10020254_59220 [Streptomyces goshikiensis]
MRSPRPYSPQPGPGAPSLTERRKAATQLDIARAACELFAEHGPDGTTAEDIAHRAGVALRTFYRYFRNKQEAVAPLLAGGGDAWRALLAEEDPGTPLAEALERAVTRSLSDLQAIEEGPGGHPRPPPRGRLGRGTARGLVPGEPGLRGAPGPGHRPAGGR